MPTPEPGTRALRFWLTENTGSGKLDYANIVALVGSRAALFGCARGALWVRARRFVGPRPHAPPPHHQLCAAHACACLQVYTMRLVMGHGKISTSPPNTDINLAGCACSAPSEFNECDALEAA